MLARGCLRLLEWPYTAAVRARNWRYDTGRSAINKVDVPVVSVGNITLGGTGKTPAVEWLVRWFTDQSADESETTAFLASRIENVMQFEKFKAQVKEGLDRLPPLADVLSAFTRR